MMQSMSMSNTKNQLEWESRVSKLISGTSNPLNKTMSDTTVEMDVDRSRLLVDLAGVARNPRACKDISVFIGGSHRITAAQRAHNLAKKKLREAENGA